VHGKRIEVKPSQFSGVRDRSWGIRQVGVPRNISQMYWLWAPLQAEDREFLFYAIEHGDGKPMIVGAQMAMFEGGASEHMADAWADLEFRPGTREISHAVLHLVRRRGRGEIRIELKPSREGRLFLSGIGYGHQEWGHGFDKGPSAMSYDTLKPGLITVHAAPYMHPQWSQYQARSEAEIFMPDGSRMMAHGMLEQILLGDHVTSGVKGVTDAPMPA
jgi:hypothetical protein